MNHIAWESTVDAVGDFASDIFHILIAFSVKALKPKS